MQDGLVKELDQEHEFAQYGLDKTLLLRILSKKFTSYGTIPNQRLAPKLYIIAAVEAHAVNVAKVYLEFQNLLSS